MTNDDIKVIDKSEAIAFALFHRGLTDMEEARKIYIKEYVDSMGKEYNGSNGTRAENTKIAAEKWERQKDEIFRRLNWGGKREGAGRPKEDTIKSRWNVTVTPEEKEYLKQKLEEYRNK